MDPAEQVFHLRMVADGGSEKLFQYLEKWAKDIVILELTKLLSPVVEVKGFAIRCGSEFCGNMSSGY